MPTLDRVAETADGVRLSFGSDGSDQGAPLLLIPGLGAAATVFDPILPALRTRHRVIVYDPRAIGASEPGAQPLTMTLMVSDAVTVLDAAGAGVTNIFGGSMGGAVAQHLVLRHPERVAALVLAATAPAGLKAIPAAQRATDLLMGRGARTPEEAYRRATSVLYSPHFQRTHRDFIEEQVRQRGEHPVRPRVFSEQLNAMQAAEDITPELSRITSPTLVAHGTADVVTPIENARVLASLIPGARTRWFEGCGHLFFHERPEESARVVHEFIREAGRSSA